MKPCFFVEYVQWDEAPLPNKQNEVNRFPLCIFPTEIATPIMRSKTVHIYQTVQNYLKFEYLGEFETKGKNILGDASEA